MKTPRFLLATNLIGVAALAATTLAPTVAHAQATVTAVTDPVGYLTTALPANSDTYVSIPFTRPAEFTGAVASVAGNIITLAGTPGFSAGGFVYGNTASSDVHKTYYVIVGPKSAALTPTLTVTNGSPTATASANLTEPVAGDTVTVAGYTFTVAAVSGQTLTLDRAFPGTTASGVAATYNHSPSEGRFYTVTANDTGSLTVNLNGDSLSNVTPGTQVSVIPYWTLGRAFPAGDAGKSFTTSSSSKVRGTQILFSDLVSPGVNLAPRVVYYHLNGAWRQAGVDTTITYDDDVLVPDTFFLVRNAATATTFVPNGAVAVNRLSTPLAAQASGQQDNAVGLNRPVSVSLNDLGLIRSGAFVTSTSTKTRADQLLVFDNGVAGINKSFSAAYFFYNNAWRKAGADATLDFGTDTLPAGTGAIVRKTQTATNTTSFWQNARNFLN